ncbi:MAG: hypothetical protein WCX73_02145 [Candidatus Pacearchaeota archaeon]|jgi:hypothetical protein
MKKRGMAGLIVVVLLILLSFLVFVISYNVFKNQIMISSSSIESKVYAINNINLEIKDFKIQGQNLEIEVTNKGQQSISGFIVEITSNTGEVYSNNSIYFQNHEKLGPLNTNSIIIVPAPFGVDISNYKLIVVYPKFIFNSKEEIAEIAKASYSVSEINDFVVPEIILDSCVIDGMCNNTETCFFCAQDCGACSCGDGICNTTARESINNCWKDCGYGNCGDGICNSASGETTVNCSEDCGQDYKVDIYKNLSNWTIWTSWFNGTENPGRSFLVSPVINAGSGNEQAYHWINITYASTNNGKVRIFIGHYSSNNLLNVMNITSYHYGNYLVNSGETKYIAIPYPREAFSWVIIEKDSDVIINSINHTYWVGYNTIYGHKARNYSFTNSYLPYRIMYPANYNASKSYPLVASMGGSGEAGKDNIANMGSGVLGSILFKSYYYNPQFEAFSIVLQAPYSSNDTTKYYCSQSPAPYYPFGDRGGYTSIYHPDLLTVSKDGFFTEATVALIQEMLDNPNMNINENKIYFTGLSYGGKASYEIARESPDLWAAVWAVAGWPIGKLSINYSTPSGDSEMELGMIEEAEIFYKNIPFRVSDGANDSMMVYGGALACYTINKVGGSCIRDITQNCNHNCICSNAYQLSRIQWLFNQSKSSN